MSQSIPQKLYFTLKFYTFKTVETEKVVLKNANDEASKREGSMAQGSLSEMKIKLGA